MLLRNLKSTVTVVGSFSFPKIMQGLGLGVCGLYFTILFIINIIILTYLPVKECMKISFQVLSNPYLF